MRTRGTQDKPSRAEAPADDIPFEPFTVPTAPEPAYLLELNPAQRKAVEALEGPVLVLAGAGTGKTRVLTTRLAHLLALRRAAPWELLAVTFTNQAAREMQSRVAALAGAAASDVQLGTFHAIAARILRRHADQVGLKPNFTILDSDDQVRLAKQVIEAAGLDTARWPGRALQAFIERGKDKGLRPDQVGRFHGEFADGRAVELYADYETRLAALNAVDFGGLLLHNISLFTRHPDVLARYHQRFRYLLVDEYQDTNLAQYLWLRLLAQKHRNIYCVGDDDQSIYAWRGAEIGNILKFERDFPGARVVRLEQNYRSTGAILAAASHLIAHNSGRLGKSLWSEAPAGERIQVRGVRDGGAEARFVADEIEALQRRKHRLEEIAVLVRAGFQTREFEERFLEVALPYRIVGGPRFYERQEIRDAVAYLRTIHQPDDDLAFERILNRPKRGLGEVTLQSLHKQAREKHTSLSAAAQSLAAGTSLKPAARSALREFTDDLNRWRKLAGAASHVEFAATVLDESGYAEMWRQDKSPDAPGRVENLKELMRALAEFENHGGFLEHISLVMEMNEDIGADRINLMTLHSAKGLEFETVFLPGWEEGVFPHQRSLDEKGDAGLEEERRLAYVGLTRAKRRAVISYAASRRVHSQWQYALRSRFIAELPPNELELENDTGIGGAPMWPQGGERLIEFLPERGGAPYPEPSKRGWRDGAPGPTRYVIEGTAEPSRGAQSPRQRIPRGDAGLYKSRASPIVVAVGDRVFHQTFGYGTVTEADGENTAVRFDLSDTKKVKSGKLLKS